MIERPNEAYRYGISSDEEVEVYLEELREEAEEGMGLTVCRLAEIKVQGICKDVSVNSQTPLSKTNPAAILRWLTCKSLTARSLSMHRLPVFRTSLIRSKLSERNIDA